jgi:hypothetical protein
LEIAEGIATRRWWVSNFRIHPESLATLGEVSDRIRRYSRFRNRVVRAVIAWPLASGKRAREMGRASRRFMCQHGLGEF